MANFDVDTQVKTIVDHAKDPNQKPDQAYAKLKEDITNSGAVKGTDDYKNLVSKAAEALQKEGKLPVLSLGWAAEQAAAPGKTGISREDLTNVVKGAETNKENILDAAFASTVNNSFDKIKDANIDIDPATGAEREQITIGDVRQVYRQAKTEGDLNTCLVGKGQAEADLKDEKTKGEDLKKNLEETGKDRDKAAQERDNATKAAEQLKQNLDQTTKERESEAEIRKSEAQTDISKREATNSTLSVHAGEGYWHLAKRMLAADGHKHSNAEVNAMHLHLKELNHGKALNPNDSIILRTKEEEDAAVQNGLKAFEEQEKARREKAAKAVAPA